MFNLKDTFEWIMEIMNSQSEIELESTLMEKIKQI